MSNSNQPDNSKHPTAARWLRIAGIAVVVFFAACIVIWRMLVYTPAIYQPVTPTDSGQVSPYLTHKLAPDIYNNIQLDEPFRIIVEQSGINDIVARWFWLVQSAWFSAHIYYFLISELMCSFEYPINNYRHI